MSTAAWADTTIGGKGKGGDANAWYGWADTEAHTTASALAAGKTRTITFTVTDYDNVTVEADNWAGYVVSLSSSTVPFLGDNGWLRGCDNAYYKTDWNTGALSNSSTFGGMTKTQQQLFIKGATIVLAIQRYDTQIYVKATITKDETTYARYYVVEAATKADIYPFLCADAASITITSDVTTDTNVIPDRVSVLVGKEDNSDTYGAFYTQCPLAPNGIVSYHFKNYNKATGNTYETWTIRMQDGNGHWFNISSGDLAPWGELVDGAVTSKSVKSANWPASGDVLTKFNNADVTLTIARSGRIVTFTSVIDPTEGDPFGFKYTLEPPTTITEFASYSLFIDLIGRSCHMDNYYPVDKVNAEVNKCGWATFSSSYKLDFSGVSGLNAYAVTDHGVSTITKSAALGVVAANTGLLLENTAGVGDDPTFYNIPVSTGEAYSGANFMVSGTGEAVSQEGGYDRYVLVNNSGTAVFKKITSNPATVAANRAYLQFTTAVIPSRDILSIDGGDATGINMINGEGLKINGSEVYYNLQGQRVLYPTKGLYIVNGKKVIIK